MTSPQSGTPLLTAPETQVFFGIIIQIGMYALIIVVASILMKNGLSVAPKKQ